LGLLLDIISWRLMLCVGDGICDKNKLVSKTQVEYIPRWGEGT
jgi:hypothetical protein